MLGSLRSYYQIKLERGQRILRLYWAQSKTLEVTILLYKAKPKLSLTRLRSVFYTSYYLPGVHLQVRRVELRSVGVGAGHAGGDALPRGQAGDSAASVPVRIQDGQTRQMSRTPVSMKKVILLDVTFVFRLDTS